MKKDMRKFYTKKFYWLMSCAILSFSSAWGGELWREKEPSFTLSDFPNEIKVHIVSFLNESSTDLEGKKALCALTRVNTEFREIVSPWVKGYVVTNFPQEEGKSGKIDYKAFSQSPFKALRIMWEGVREEDQPILDSYIAEEEMDIPNITGPGTYPLPPENPSPTKRSSFSLQEAEDLISSLDPERKRGSSHDGPLTHLHLQVSYPITEEEFPLNREGVEILKQFLSVSWRDLESFHLQVPFFEQAFREVVSLDAKRCPSLKKLSLSHSHLGISSYDADIPAWMACIQSSLPQVTYLDLSSNPFQERWTKNSGSSLKKIFPNLQILDFSDNETDSTCEGIKNLYLLKILSSLKNFNILKLSEEEEYRIGEKRYYINPLKKMIEVKRRRELDEKTEEKETVGWEVFFKGKEPQVFCVSPVKLDS